MNNPKLIELAKKLFHTLTIASTALASFGSAVPAKYAFYIAFASAAISGLLHLITQLWPAIAAGEPK